MIIKSKCVECGHEIVILEGMRCKHLGICCFCCKKNHYSDFKECSILTLSGVVQCTTK